MPLPIEHQGASFFLRSYEALMEDDFASYHFHNKHQKYAIDMRLCGQERSKTRLNSHKLTCLSVNHCYHLISFKFGLRHHDIEAS